MSGALKKLSLLDELLEAVPGTYVVGVDGQSGKPLDKKMEIATLMQAGVEAIYLGEVGSVPSAPPSGKMGIYSLGGKLYSLNSSGVSKEIGSGVVNPAITNCRLSLAALATDDPEVDVASSNVLRILPWGGNRVSLYESAAGVYEDHELSALMIRTKTTTQTGDLTSGSAVISDYSGEWYELHVGMEISGLGIAAGATIVSYDMGAKTITMSAAATADGNDVTLTTQTPADSVMDVFLYLDNGVVKAMVKLWGSTSARGYSLDRADGILSYGSKVYKYIGTVMTTSTAGELRDDQTVRGVWNYYNPIRRAFKYAVAGSHSYSSDWRYYNADASGFTFVSGQVAKGSAFGVCEMNPSTDGYAYLSFSMNDLLTYGLGAYHWNESHKKMIIFPDFGVYAMSGKLILNVVEKSYRTTSFSDLIVEGFVLG